MEVPSVFIRVHLWLKDVEQSFLDSFVRTAGREISSASGFIF
jgi:hypothetical protein